MITVLSGAGMSAESGLATFRGAGGLWEGHDIKEVASPEGWRRNPDLVNHFYNERRRQLKAAKPNAAHRFLAQLESKTPVFIVTQNVDDLHERAGSSEVLHLHGELKKVRSEQDPSLVYDWPGDLSLDDRCDKGGRLRPHVVWFGEEVPEMPNAIARVGSANVIVIIGTSLQVYPAANLVTYRTPGTPVIYIDPYPAGDATAICPGIRIIEKKATESLRELEALLREVEERR